MFGETLDDPKGMVHIRDFLDYIAARAEAGRPSSPERPGEKPPSLGEVDLSVTLSTARILRPVLFAPPSMPAVDLLVRMQATRTHMALVIDEYGGTDGLVSIEDLVEMVVGDIEDEHDVASGRMILREGDTFVADARASLEEVSEALGVDLAIGDIGRGGRYRRRAHRDARRPRAVAKRAHRRSEPARVRGAGRRPAPGEAAAHPSPPRRRRAAAGSAETRGAGEGAGARTRADARATARDEGSRRAASRHDDGGAAGTHGRERPPGMKALASRVILASGWQRALIGFAAGAAGALAMPPFGILPALAVSLTVAVWLVDGAAAGGRFGAASTLISAGVAGWWWGFGYFVAGLWWLGSAFLVEADQFAWALPFGVLGLPALLAVFSALGFALSRALWSPGAGRLFAFAFGLTVAEWLRGTAFTGFPWNTIGMALGQNLWLMQAASAIGLYGLTILAILICAAPATLGTGDAGSRRWAAPGLAVSALRAPRRVRSLARARAPRRRPSPG